MSEYGHVRAYLDPLGLVRFPDGSCQYEIELALTNDPERDPVSILDPVCTLDAARARELAFQLLELAEHATPMRTHR
jgi:hypothetical protein